MGAAAAMAAAAAAAVAAAVAAGAAAAAGTLTATGRRTAACRAALSGGTTVATLTIAAVSGREEAGREEAGRVGAAASIHATRAPALAALGRHLSSITPLMAPTTTADLMRRRLPCGGVFVSTTTRRLLLLTGDGKAIDGAWHPTVMPRGAPRRHRHGHGLGVDRTSYENLSWCPVESASYMV